MNDFKVGDEVYVTHSELMKKENTLIPCSIFKVSIVMIREEPESCLVQPLPIGSLYSCQKHQIYKTKNAAIDAMIKRLEEIRE